ncbi:hypothetical protein C7H19_21485 [Aphanothece hegewaldii CCALA 016]|uniref:Uncharacterized protein n=1 Tax=Aphanothece hegewaldii CCALA 016 TaxID=2107694 RepID=A0A2T1LS93_9CHRO|nr:hypothetical protein [Aphanothece hegewaldii]PSF32472.1 hypothetical protein C7H19_21485 [Aphanothece hegewaldii CCALA 016]
MIVLKILVIAAALLVIIKFAAALLGKDNIPILNQLVTVILSLFITFELFKLGQVVLEKFS